MRPQGVSLPDCYCITVMKMLMVPQRVIENSGQKRDNFVSGQNESIGQQF